MSLTFNHGLMINWRFRHTVIVTVVAWAVTTVLSIVLNSEYALEDVLGGGLLLGFMIGIVAILTRYSILGVTRQRFENIDDGTPAYPITCGACGLNTQYCVQKGRIIASFVGYDVADLGSKHRMFCPDCGADFWITADDYERCLNGADDLQEFQRGNIGEAEYGDRLFDLEDDVSFINDPDPRLKSDNRADIDVTADKDRKGFH